MQNPHNLSQAHHTLDWDWFVTSSEYDRDSVKSAYGYTCPLKILGTPRTDALFEKFDNDKIKKQLGITENKKIVFYAYDLDEYISIRKGFYLDYKKDLPWPIAYNEDGLKDILNNIDRNIVDYKADVLNFNHRFNSMNDGNVCSRIFNELLNGGFEK